MVLFLSLQNRMVLSLLHQSFLILSLFLSPQNLMVLSYSLQNRVAPYLLQNRMVSPFPFRTSWFSLLSFRTVWSFSPCQNRMALSLSPQNLVVPSSLWLPCLGLNPSAHLPSQPHFRLLLQLSLIHI